MPDFLFLSTIQTMMIMMTGILIVMHSTHSDTCTCKTNIPYNSHQNGRNGNYRNNPHLTCNLQDLNIFGWLALKTKDFEERNIKL